MINNLLTIGSIFYSILLIIVYFGKSRIRTVETKIYSYLIIANFFGLLIAIGCYYTVLNCEAVPNLNYLVSRLYLMYLVIYILIFFYYLIVNLYYDNDEVSEKRHGFLAILIVTFFVISDLIFVFPLYYNNVEGAVYSYGPSANIIYVFATLCMVIWTILLVFNFRKLKSKKMLPIIFFIIGAALVTVVQKINPSLLLMTSMETFVLVIMYFTIENPDLKILKELNFQREQVATSKELTGKIIDSLGHNFDSYISIFKDFGKKKINYSDKENLENEIKKMQDFSLKFSDDANNLLELAKIQSENFEIENIKYEPIQLINDITDLLKVANTKVKTKVNLNCNLPQVLYGDSNKIRNIITYFYGGILKIANIEEFKLEISDMTAGNLYRLKFRSTIKKSDLKEEYQDITNIDILDFEVVKRLSVLMNGKFTINNNDNIEFLLNINQRLVNEYEKYKEEIKDNSKIRVFEIPNKRILFIDDNKSRIKEIKLMLSPYKVEFYSASNIFELKEIFESDKTFDLILIDDIMPDIEEVKSYLLVHTNKKLFRIMSNEAYEVVKVMLVTPNKENYEQKYLNEGFDDVIKKPLSKYKIHDILKKYLK